MAHANARLEAFCDGVFAIAITLLILEVHAPTPSDVGTTAELWGALTHLLPSLFAFLLSFAVILITWVNHHGALRLLNGTCASFMYANGFLLLAVVSIPFTAGLLGEFLLTDHAAPAVVLYDAVLAALALGWVFLTESALRNKLTIDEHATATTRANARKSYVAVALYSGLAVVAIWLPMAVAIVTTASWVSWLILGLRLKHV